MVLGDSMSVLLKLNVDISELSKLTAARKAVSNFEDQMNETGRRTVANTKSISRGMERLGDEFMFTGTNVDKLKENIDGFSVSASRTSGIVDILNSDLAESSGIMKKLDQDFDVLSANMSKETLKMKQGITELKFAFRVLNKRIDQVAMSSRASFKIMRAGLAKLRASAIATAKSMAGMSASLQGARMAMLNLMFTGMNLAFVFGGILALSPRIRAGFMAIVNALRLVAIEAGEILLPHLLNFSKAIRNLNEDQREFIAKLSIVGTLLGVGAALFGILGQAVLTSVGYLAELPFAAIKAAKKLKILGGVAKTAGGFIFGAMKKALLGVISFVGGLSTPVLIAIGIIGALAAAWFLASDKTKKAIKDMLAKLKPAFNFMIDIVKFFAVQWMKNLSDALTMMGKFIKNVTQPIYQIIKPALKTLAEIIVVSIDVLMEAFSKGRKQVKKFAKGAVEFLTGLAKGAKSVLNDAIDTAVKTANAFIKARNAMIDKAKNKMSLLTPDKFKIGSMAEKAANKYKKIGDKRDELAQNLALKFGGEDAMKQVKGVQDFMDDAVAGMDDFGQKIIDTGSKIGDMAKKLQDTNITVDNLGDLLKGAGDKAKKGLAGIVPKIKKKLKGGMKALKGNKALGGIVGNITGLLGMGGKGGMGGIGGIGKLLNGPAVGNRPDIASGNTQTQKNEKKEITNNTTVEVEEINDEVDIDNLAQRLAEIQEREQKRTKNVI